MKRLSGVLKGKVIHFIGIGGAGMNPMAHMLLDIGRSVSGSDVKTSRVTEALLAKGSILFLSHDKHNVDNADIVVFSSAITESNPELIAARAQGKIVYHRSEMLNQLMLAFPNRVAVSGTHGKTTTTGMISYILSQTPEPASFMVGSVLENLETSYYYTKASTFVAEADESDGSFLNLQASIGVITNIEDEHMNYYGNSKNLLSHFEQFSDTIIREKGRVIYNYNDVMTASFVSRLDATSLVSFGIDPEADVSACNIVFSEKGVTFNCLYKGALLGTITQGLYGYHNVCNALASIATCLTLGCSFQSIQAGLATFKGTRRRLQYVGTKNGITIYDDYGHHPTEIKTTLEALRHSFKSKIFCVFQPHRFSRTRDLLSEFALSFESADHIILTPIFSAYEDEIPGISTQSIIDKMPAHISCKTEYIENMGDINNALSKKARSGDIIITMGAGNIHTVSGTLMEDLETNEPFSIQGVRF